ncbi:S-adenosyl-L-methionine-dependent methyltransferase [Punctularia strigosozonata HHB-11173 SS5]|uniref:S-adenosyl-L-methionine-dependent methyltransferase n=1 Tax=Punctularia strigosozonata (strain HHB-11173) TaxID=741275 RepID=UPI0004416803|nr:S-adenosyl-L-methionine-dependent methyltransferase [Punctularia strigosozonata HHB-11173 SS5]EIN06326.1 S-adenosyl-L-methionine-dependent methyltransferase [Punctularia strigosozonata HHB-11173 SS5]
MGRRHNALAGVSRYLQVVKSADAAPTDDTSDGHVSSPINSGSLEYLPTDRGGESALVLPGDTIAGDGDARESGSAARATTIATANEAPTSDATRSALKRSAPDETGSANAENASQRRKRKRATGLVPFYTDASQVPEALQKYFSQRYRYFTLYDRGCLLDEEGWYSVTPERIADQIAERCRCDVVLDAFCGVGGNAIAFAKTCERVIAMDTSPLRLALARHNATVYGVADRIEFVLGDYVAFAKSYASGTSVRSSATATAPSSPRKIDVVFLSPPWGGPSYLAGSPVKTKPAYITDQDEEDLPVEDRHPTYSLSSIQPVHGAELFRLTRKITHNVAYFLPRNTGLEEIGALLPCGESGTERVEVEEAWMGSKLKALTCYFGGLAASQEYLF